MKRILFLLLIVALPFGTLFASGAQEGAGEGEPEVIELTATLLPAYEMGVMQQFDNPDNVVTPYITERFGLEITEIRKVPPDMTYPQAIGMWKAAGVAPDIMQCGAEDFGAMVNSGIFAPLDEYLAEMENYEKFLPEQYWNREVGPDGKVYAFYNLPGYEWPQPEPPSDDVVTNSSNVRALWVREDVLDAIGYDYTPIEELKEQTIDQGIRPTFEQLEIDPPIDSPEAFMEMLRAIKAADLKAIDGSDVIPFSMVWWETWHLGVMYDWGYWRINRDGEVDGYLGLPGAKDYLHWLWTAYSEGLIDPDYLVHQSVQLQEKVTTGRVAAGEYVPDANAVFAALEDNVPGAVRHFFPFPKSNPDAGFYDPYNPHPYHRTLLNKELSDEAMQRIANFVDWTYSDEGAEILAWGPPEAGLYEEVNGERRFVDPAVEEAVLGGSVEGPGPYKYGIFDSYLRMSPDPLTNALGPTQLHETVFMEYDATGNWMSLMSSIVGSEPRFRGTSTELQVANSDQTDLVQGVADWYWGIFSETYLPQILEAEDEAEFEERFDAMIEVFMAETNYAQAKANMEAYFEEFPPVWND